MREYDIKITSSVKLSQQFDSTDGKPPRVSYFQLGWLNTGKDSDIEISIPLASASAPWAVGYYVFSQRNFLLGSDQYKRLTVNRDYAPYANLAWPLVVIDYKSEEQKRIDQLESMLRSIKSPANAIPKQAA